MTVGVCRVCECTDDDCEQCVRATGSPCTWAEPDLCSRCANERALLNLRAACAELRGAVNLVKVRLREVASDPLLVDRADVVGMALAKVGGWLIRMAKQRERDSAFDYAELRILVRDFGNDDDDTTMMDVGFQERVWDSDLSGRVEGVGGPAFRARREQTTTGRGEE